MNKTFKYFLSIIGSLMLLTPHLGAISIAKPTQAPHEHKIVKARKVKKAPESLLKSQDSISIPGFTQMDLAAGKREQVVSFYNPKQNRCYFKISIILEDGSLLWQSGLLKPGYKITKICLLKDVDEKTCKDATIKYDCFSMNKALTALNSAKVKLRLAINKQ